MGAEQRDRWDVGQVIARREILGFEPTGTTGDAGAGWLGKSWLEFPVRVVEDSDAGLVFYVAPGTPLTLPTFDWPAVTGLHPWHERTGWQGAGCLMLHPPGQHHAIWHFWSDSPERQFQCWYINIQTIYRRVGAVFETQDLELDYIVGPDRAWVVKDWDALDERVADGRFSAELVDWIRNYGIELSARLEQGEFWWDESWSEWTPPPEWEDGSKLRLPD